MKEVAVGLGDTCRLCGRILLDELQGVLRRELQVIGNALDCGIQPGKNMN